MLGARRRSVLFALCALLCVSVSWVLQFWHYRQALASVADAPWVGQGPPNELLSYVLTTSSDDVARRQGGDVVEALGVSSGQRVADVGCGSGVYSLFMANVVGDKGRVWAVDINPDAVSYVAARAQALGFRNVVAVKSSPGDASLAPASVDRVLLSNVLHCFLNESNQDDEPTFETVTRPFLASLLRALVPQGRLLVLDFGRAPGGKTGGGVNGRAVRRAFHRVGFHLVWSRGDDDGDYQILLKSPMAPAPPRSMK